MNSDNRFSLVSLADITPEAWDAVTRGRALPTQHYAWVAAAAEAHAQGGATKVALVGAASAPRALAPLGREPDQAGRLGWLGCETLSEGYEVIAVDDAARHSLAQGLVRLGRPLAFGHYHADTPWIDALKQACRGRGLVMVRARAERSFPVIALSPEWRDPISQMRARANDHKRKVKAAAKLGAIAFSAVTPKRDQLSGLMDEVLTVEARNWKGRAGSAVLCNPPMERFYRRYAELACDAGILRLFFLRIGADIAAVQIAVETENAFWQHKIGYDEKFQRVSPGNLLMAETIRWSAERGLAAYNFMGKEADWTLDWTDVARPCAAVRIYPFNLVGAMAAGFDGLDLGWRAVKKKLKR
jgi:CelD/BcsL family acetyltransferase involved in cellulose biosynthesis